MKVCKSLMVEEHRREVRGTNVSTGKHFWINQKSQRHFVSHGGGEAEKSW